MRRDSGDSFGQFMLPAEYVCLKKTCGLFLHVCFFFPFSCSPLDQTVCIFYFFMLHWQQSSSGNFVLKKKENVHKAHEALTGVKRRDSLIKSHPRVKACRYRLPSHPSPDSSFTRGTGAATQRELPCLKTTASHLGGDTF